MDSFVLYADKDIADMIERETHKTGEFVVFKRVNSYTECLTASSRIDTEVILVIQAKTPICSIQDLLFELDCRNQHIMFLLFEVVNKNEIRYTTTDQRVYPTIAAVACFFEGALSDTYSCVLTYARTTIWEKNFINYPDTMIRSEVLLEILRGCTSDECIIHKDRFSLDLKEKGYYLYFYETQPSEYKDHIVNKDVYNFVGELLKRECISIIRSYNGGEIFDITLDFMCIIINDLTIRSEARKTAQLEEMVQKLLVSTGCKAATRYLSLRYEKMKDLRRGYDRYRTEKTDFFFKKDENIVRATHTTAEKHSLEFETVFKLLAEIANILHYDLYNSALENILHHLYIDILKPSFNVSIFYYCTTIIFSEIIKAQDSTDGRLLGENLNPGLIQFSSIEEQYDTMLQRIRTLKLDNAKKHHTRNAIVLNAMNYISENYANIITISDIAEAVKTSKEYLSRIYKSRTGISVIHHLVSIRIQEAQKLLLETDDPIYSVADKTGFSDPRHFSKTFKKITGFSPQDFRKKKHSAM